MQTKGFALLDVLITIIILSTFILLCSISQIKIDEDYYSFESNYLLKQSEAMLQNETIEFNDNIRFNEKGNVNHARTIHFSSHYKIHDVIVELGGGRLVYKK